MIGRDQGEAEAVLAGKVGGDFGVAADGIAVAGEVGAEIDEDLGDDAEIGGDAASAP